MVVDDNRCNVCKTSGLAIYPARYAVVPKTFVAPPLGPFQGTGVVDVSLTENKYTLRQLREGFLYLFYESGALGKNYWEVYQVASDGSLQKLADPSHTPVVGTSATCTRSGHNPLRTLFLVVEKPEQCSTLWMAFSEYPWSDETRQNYATNTDFRAKRMQLVKPADWMVSPIGGPHTAPLTTDNLQHITEYSPTITALTPDEVFELPYEFRPTISENGKGGYRSQVLKQCTTRYSWHIRQGWWNKTSAEKLVEQAKKSNSKNGSNSGDFPPMMIALWDAIGIAHELNGFCNDPVAWLNQYNEERALQILALNDIDIAKAILEKRRVDKVKMAQSEVEAGGSNGLKDAAADMRREAAELQGSERDSQLKLADDYDYLAEHGLGGPFVAEAKNLNTDAERSAWRAKTDRFILGRDKAKQEDLDAAYNGAWAPYESKLERAAIEAFRGKYEGLKVAVGKLQEARSHDISVWLSAPLWLNTLEDYHQNNLIDGLAFESVVAEALFGLASTPTGKAKVNALVRLTDATKQESIVWRALAMNQQDSRREMALLLHSADEKKQTRMPEGLAAVNTIIGQAKSLTGYYKKLSKLATETDAKKITPAGRVLQRLAIDKLGMSIGDSVFELFRINQGGDFVGEKVIQTLFLQRAGFSDTDALALVRKQAELESLSRAETINRLLVTRRLLRAPAAGGAPASTVALYDTYEAMKLTQEGTNQLRMARIATVVGLLELVNFIKLAVDVKSDPSKSSAWVKLTGSGASLCAAVIEVGMAPYYAVLKKTSRALKWRLIGGFLGSVGVFVAAWSDVQKTSSHSISGRYDVASIYTVKAVIGAGSGGAILVDSISSAAPLLRKVAVRYGLDFISSLVETWTVRAAEIAALRAVGILMGWEVVIGLTVLQFIADWLTPDDLESWCVRSSFGVGKESIFRVFDHEVNLYKDPKRQEDDFVKAITSVE